MSRKLLTGIALEETFSPHPQSKMITPTPRASRRYDQPAMSLERYARRYVQKTGYNIVSEIESHYFLKEAVQQIQQRGMFQFPDPDGYARVAMQPIREIFRAGIDLHAIDSIGASTKTKRLLHTAAQYQSLLRTHCYIDQSEILTIAAQYCRDNAIQETLAVIGYPRFSLDEQWFIHAVCDEHSQVNLPFYEHALFQENHRTIEQFKHHQWQVESPDHQATLLGNQLAIQFLTKQPVPQAIQCYSYPDQETEIRAALSQVKQLLDQGVHENDIVFVVRNEHDYGALLQAISIEYGVPFRARYEAALHQTRLGGWIKNLIQAILNNLSFEDTLKILAHPLGWDVPGTANVPFGENWSQWRKTYPSGLEKWQLQQIDTTLFDWLPHDQFHHYLQQLDSVIEAFRVKNRCAYWSRETLAFTVWETCLEQLAKRNNGKVTLERFAQDISEILNMVKIPIQPGRGGIELHTTYALHGTQYQHVFVLGVAERVLPAPVQDKHHLDYYEREHLDAFKYKLEHSIDASNREQLSFLMLLKSVGKSLTLSYPAHNGEQDQLPSIYFRHLGIKPTLNNLTVLNSHQEYIRHQLQLKKNLEDPIFKQAKRACQIEHHRETAPHYDEYDGYLSHPIPLKNRKLSPSQLLQLGQCPFKWFAGTLLKLADLEEFETELSASKKGMLFHLALQKLIEKYINQETGRDSWEQLLDRCFQEAEQKYQLTSLPGWSAQRPELLNQLKSAISGKDFCFPEATPTHCEHRFEFQWKDFTFTGVIDRIDHSPKGVILIDYKASGSKPSGIQDDKGFNKVDIQLPLYRMAAQHLFPDQPVYKAYYYSVTKGKKLSEAKDESQVIEFLDLLQERLSNGRFPVRPDVENNACRYCSFKPVCRVGSRVERKEESQ